MQDETLLAEVRQCLVAALLRAGASVDLARTSTDAMLADIEAFAAGDLFVVSDRDPLVRQREQLRSAAMALQRFEKVARELDAETKRHIQLSKLAANAARVESFDAFIQRAQSWHGSLRQIIASIRPGTSGPLPDDEVRAVFRRCVRHWIDAAGSAPPDWRKAKSDGEPELLTLLFRAAFATDPVKADRLSAKKFARAIQDLLDEPSERFVKDSEE